MDIHTCIHIYTHTYTRIPLTWELNTQHVPSQCDDDDDDVQCENQAVDLHHDKPRKHMEEYTVDVLMGIYLFFGLHFFERIPM